MEDVLLHSFASLLRVIVGWAVAVVCGVVFGLLRANLPKPLRQNIFFNMLLEIPRFPPPIAWIPFVVIAFGASEVGAYIIVFIGAFPPVFVATYEAAQSLPASMIRFVNSLRISTREKIQYILLPYMAPGIFTSMKVAAGMAWMCVVAAEMISGQSGLGYAIQLSRMNMQYMEIVYYMIAIGLIGFLIHFSLNFAERKWVPWTQKG